MGGSKIRDFIYLFKVSWRNQSHQLVCRFEKNPEWKKGKKKVKKQKNRDNQN